MKRRQAICQKQNEVNNMSLDEEMLKNHIIQAIRHAKENNLSEDDFTELIDKHCPVVQSGKIWIGIIENEEFDYICDIAEAKFNFPTYWGDEEFADWYYIWECCRGYLVVNKGYAYWYPRDYQYIAIQKDGFDIIETENFMTPEFLLHPSRLYKYILKIGAEGYSMIYDDVFEYGVPNDKEPEHANDFVKYYLVHENIFPERPTTKLLEDSIAEIDDIVAKSKDIDISSKIDKFYDLVNDIYYNRSGADYSRGLLRDGYINFGLQVPTYVPSKLDVNKYDDVSEC